MISVFLEQISAERNFIEMKGISILSVHKSEEDVERKSVYVDLLSSQYIARVTLWETGTVDFEKLLISTEEIVYYESLTVDKENYKQVFRGFIEKITE